MIGSWNGSRWWADVGRVGEADNPGPTSVSLAVDGVLRKVYSTARAAMNYPSPGKRSLRGAVAPGYRTDASDLEQSDQFALAVEAANTTGWKGLQRRLVASSAHALLAQETWVTQDAIPAASAWALRRGWKSVWTAAQPGPNGGASGGTAIFVRDYLGLRYPPGSTHEWCPGRAVAGILDAPCHRPMLLVSCYLVHGIGPAQANLELLATIGERRQAMRCEHELLLGGDLNMDPPDFALTGFEAQMGATVLAPGTARGTFRTAKSASLLDYFVVSNRTATAVQSVATVEAAGTKGHAPVLLKFRPKATSLRALHLRRPPALELSRLYGPIEAPPDWSHARAVAESALAAAKNARADTQEYLDEAYRVWADLAEKEVASYTGVQPKKFGERGRLPNFVWRSVVPEATPTREAPDAAAAAWLGGMIKELARICSTFADAPDLRRDDADDLRDDPFRDAGDVDVDSRRELEVRTARARRPPTSRRGCARVVREINESLKVDFPGCSEGAIGEEIRLLLAGVEGCADRLSEAIARVDVDAAAQTEGSRGRQFEDINSTVTVLAATAADIEARTTAQANSEAHRRWREWVAEGVEKGAARAHAYTRGPKAWTPTVATAEDGSQSGTLDDLVADQRAKYAKLWKPAQRPFHYGWTERDALPRMSPEQMREASKTFPETTATTFDGFHPRHFACLSEDSLNVLAAILEAVEVSAMWPRQLSMIIAALLPKATGGFRPIGIAPAVYRLWSKVRKADADEWERKHPRAYFSASKGCGPVDAMWRLAAQQEAGVAEGHVAATVSEDVQSFFETLDRERLANEARALNFPLPIVRAAFAAYSSARVVTMGGRVSREVYPTTGVVAGCSLAMAFTKVYCIRAMDDFVTEAPKGVQLGTFVDDLTLSTVGPPAAVAEDIVRAHALLKDVVQGTLGCSLAEGKAAVTATTRSLAATIARRLQIPGGTRAAATLLGIDNTAAAPRIALRARSKKAARLKAAMARKKEVTAGAKGHRGSRQEDVRGWSSTVCDIRHPHLGHGRRRNNEAQEDRGGGTPSAGKGPLIACHVAVARRTDGGSRTCTTTPAGSRDLERRHRAGGG